MGHPYKILKLQKLSIAFFKNCARIESTILMEVYISWPMLLVTLASAAAPALTVAPWAQSPRATLSMLSTPAPALIAAPVPVPAPWAQFPRADRQKNDAGRPALFFYTIFEKQYCNYLCNSLQ